MYLAWLSWEVRTTFPASPVSNAAAFTLCRLFTCLDFAFTPTTVGNTKAAALREFIAAIDLAASAASMCYGAKNTTSICGYTYINLLFPWIIMNRAYKPLHRPRVWANFSQLSTWHLARFVLWNGILCDAVLMLQRNIYTIARSFKNVAGIKRSWRW